MEYGLSLARAAGEDIQVLIPIRDTVTYVSALLWVISWPVCKLQLYVDAFKALDCQAVQESDVTLVFDRYLPGSIKTFTRIQRAGSTRYIT